MQYGDDGIDVEPGQHISVEGDDLGAASLDLDGDGMADSIVVGRDTETTVVTDYDSDGVADSISVYDGSGDLLDARVDSPFGPDIQPQSPATNTSLASTLVALDTDGKQYDLGPATMDLNEDGIPETVVATGEDGQTLAYTDRTGDGVADQIMRISATGAVEILSSDGFGSWQVAETGQMSPDGNYVADGQVHGPDAVRLLFTNDDGHSQQLGAATVDLDGDGTADSVRGTLEDGTEIAYTDVDGNGTVDQLTMVHPDGQVQISTHLDGGAWQVVETGSVDSDGSYRPAQADGPDSTASTVSYQTSTPGTAEQMTFTDADGRRYDLGAPTVDFDGDGVHDTVVSVTDSGTVVGYTDTDGDGIVDQVLQVEPSGQVIIGVADGNGGWEQVATGTVGANGEFVPA